MTFKRAKCLNVQCVSEVSNTLTEVAGLAAQGVELLLVRPLLIVGGWDDEEAPSPAKPATVETTADDLEALKSHSQKFCFLVR